MHAGIGIIYPIPIFAGIMLSLYAALLLPELLREGQPAKVLWNRWSAALLVAWALAIANAYHPPVKALRKAMYMATGIASHAVFEDDAFLRYTYQVRLVTPAGATLPYSRGNLFAFDIRDRVWELWWKRTQAPPVRLRDAEAHLSAWSPDAGIEARPQTVALNQIRPPLFRDNNRVPWVNVGSIEHGIVHWNHPPISSEEQLGNYMESTTVRPDA